MIHLKDLGSFESVPDLVTDIINGNITALESALNSGWDIAEPVQIGKYRLIGQKVCVKTLITLVNI